MAGRRRALRKLSDRLGCDASEPIYLGDHGWEVEIDFRRAAIWAQITSHHPRYEVLITNSPPIFFSNYNDLLYAYLLAALNGLASGINRKLADLKSARTATAARARDITKR
jgi:hypothetical protein